MIERPTGFRLQPVSTADPGDQNSRGVSRGDNILGNGYHDGNKNMRDSDYSSSLSQSFVDSSWNRFEEPRGTFTDDMYKLPEMFEGNKSALSKSVANESSRTDFSKAAAVESDVVTPPELYDDDFSDSEREDDYMSTSQIDSLTFRKQQNSLGLSNFARD